MHTTNQARIAATGMLIGLLLAGCGASSRDTTTPITTSSPTTTSTTGTTSKIAPPARAYIDAVNSSDLESLVAAFAPAGEVNDTSRSIVGRHAIREWAENEVIGGELRVLEALPMDDGQDLLVHWAPAGSAGWRAHYRFTMTETHITLADLQYA